MAKVTDIIWIPWGIPIPEPEYRFFPARRWRFDFAWLAKKVALEIEGGLWIYGRHNRASGMLKDFEKYNFAAYLGWSVLKFTPDKLKSGEAQTFVKMVLESRR